MTPEPKRRHAGRFLRVLGIGLVTAGIVFVLTLRFAPIDGLDPWVTIVGPPATIVLGAFLLYRGKQYGARAGAEWTDRDLRPPVVYLRPFAKDESLASQVFTSVLTIRVMSGLASDEEQLAKAVAGIGPLLAIGQPGERLPKPGAIRTYATDAEWKDVVSHWLSIANLIIVRPGTSRGVSWELGHVFRIGRPDRILLLFTGVKERDYQSIGLVLRDQFNICLPPFTKISSLRSVSGFFELDKHWQATFLPLTAPYWRRGPYKPMLQLFHYALKPVFNRLGVAWQPAPVSFGKIAGVSIPAAVIGAFAWVVLISLMTTPTRDGARAPVPAVMLLPMPVQWTSWHVAGLEISLPGVPQPEHVQQPMDRPAQAAIEQFEGYKITSDSLVATANRSIFKPGIRLSLDGAVQGSLRSLSASDGVANVRSSSERTTLSGRPAVRMIVQFTMDGQKVRQAVLTCLDDRTLWQVQALGPDTPEAAGTLDRIIKSITRR
jgi:hypothetical protein